MFRFDYQLPKWSKPVLFVLEFTLTTKIAKYLVHYYVDLNLMVDCKIYIFKVYTPSSSSLTKNSSMLGMSRNSIRSILGREIINQKISLLIITSMFTFQVTTDILIQLS